jgi:hypothetical protein
MERSLNHIDFLKLSHAYLRGVEIRDTTGVHTLDRDTLARQIALYLNDNTTQEQTNDQDQRHPASATDQAAA